MRPCLARTVPVPVPVMDALQEHLVVYCAGGGRTSCSSPAREVTRCGPNAKLEGYMAARRLIQP